LETPNAPERESNLSWPDRPSRSGFVPWLMRHGITILLAVAVAVWVYSYFGPEGILSIAMVAIGLGLVIFIHELGHFAVAKWCDVHVETFSIGFGPAIPGCSFQRGETLYKIAWFPFGGYVKMLGEGAEDDENDDDPRSYKNKPVWQRMAIISAGVVMNVILGGALFIFVYMAHGNDQLTGKIGQVDSGSPAWQSGVLSGSRIVQINDVQNPYWKEDVMPEIMHTRAGRTVLLKFEPPGQPGKVISAEIAPRREKEDLKPTLGIMSGFSLRLVKKPTSIWLPGPYVITSAAAQAKPALEFGDVIVGASDPANPSRVTPLADSAELDRRSKLLEGKPILLQVWRREKHDVDTLIDITVPPAYTYTLGARMRMGHVVAIRKGSPAEQAGMEVRDPSAGLEGDIIKEVEVTDADGKRLRFVSSMQEAGTAAGAKIKDLDPARLRFDLEEWGRTTSGDKTVRLTVLRPVKHAAREKVSVNLTWDSRWEFEEDLPFNLSSPWSIPGLGLAYRIETVVDGVTAGAPSSGDRLKEGDVVKAMRFQIPGRKPEERETSKWIDLEYDQWAHFFYRIQEEDYKEIGLRVEREGSTKELTLTAQPDPTWPRADRGFRFQWDTELVKADNLGQAIVMGARYTISNIRQIYQNLLAIVTGRVSFKGVAGPLRIPDILYNSAKVDVYSFLLILGMISINLAVINFLPIPILDGGHMVFLLYELVRGKAASEQVRLALTYFGLAVILSLMVFVTYLDFSWIFSRS
jgi:regulator of sigma E protease